LHAVEYAETAATLLRVVFIMVGLGLLLSLWRSYHSLRNTLGGTVKDVQTHITRIGQGNFSETAALAPGKQDSLLGWLVRTQRQLRQMEQARLQSDAKFKRLAQLYAALSACDQAIVRCAHEEELFEELCRATVEHGGIRMAWVGLIDRHTGMIRPSASFGDGLEYLDGLHVTVNPDESAGRGPIGLATRENQPYWCQDYLADPNTGPWRQLAARYGWASAAVLPLHRKDQVIGVFTVYAGEVNAFDEPVQHLLVEMASDIDYALRNFDLEAARLLDLTQRKRSQRVDALRNFMLERLSSDSPLEQILQDFVSKIEDTLAGARCSILLAERSGQTEPVPTEVSPDARKVLTWSEPIRSGESTVLGKFAIFHHTAVVFEPHQLELIEMAARLSALAIERKQAEMRLRLEAKVFEEGNEGIVITDSECRIVRVNHAFSRITGYSEAEVLGRNPSLLASGRQDNEFYRGMWEAINSKGHWQGEIWNRRKDGAIYPEWLSISMLSDSSGAVANYVAIAADISKSKEDEAQIRLLAEFDSLTGLPNRRRLQESIGVALSNANRHGSSLILMFLDLDRFKNVNDSLGHHAGDELLIQVAKRLKAVLREQDSVYRLGGDEFVLLCPDTDAAGASHLASRLLESTSHRYLIEQQELAISFSIGIALYPTDGETFDDLSMSADTAMYRAKQGGRNAYRFFTPEMQLESARNLVLENGLRRALELQQLHLVYQPQMSLRDGHVVGVEALLRWHHPTLGEVEPAEFIPIAEESGLILPIGQWVLRTATRQLRAWQDAGLPVRQIAVNLSSVQFRHANLPAMVTQVLAEAGLPAHCLELELTEGVAMNNPQGAIAVMHDLHQRGVRISIDDFGTGYSSLNYLKRFHIYKLKIDQSFVRDIADDPDDKAIVVAVIALARSLGFQTIAEGVETQGQLAFLLEHGCDEVQGYFFSVPLLADGFADFLRQHTERSRADFLPTDQSSLFK
jgi:diguanylate cyclase (GGDEF)-like protein/PAS domain S-box-containing protein